MAAVDLPEGVRVATDAGGIIVEGPLGKIRRAFPGSALALTGEKGKVTLTLRLPPRKPTRALLLTWAAHLRNMAAGVTRGYEAKLKAVAAHFPMKVQAKGDHILIENFLGEKYPRRSSLVPGTQAQVNGDEVLLSGIDIEAVGQSAANLERTTHIREYDPRVFQDGIYITQKPHAKGED